MRKGSQTGVSPLLGSATPPAAMWETNFHVLPLLVEA
jgi:hypothetical protein